MSSSNSSSQHPHAPGKKSTSSSSSPSSSTAHQFVSNVSRRTWNLNDYIPIPNSIPSLSSSSSLPPTFRLPANLAKSSANYRQDSLQQVHQSVGNTQIYGGDINVPSTTTSSSSASSSTPLSAPLPFPSSSSPSSSSSSTLSDSIGFHCKICSKTFHDNRSLLDHLNGQSHHKEMGIALSVTKPTVEEVRERIKMWREKVEREIRERRRKEKEERGEGEGEEEQSDDEESDDDDEDEDSDETSSAKGKYNSHHSNDVSNNERKNSQRKNKRKFPPSDHNNNKNYSQSASDHHPLHASPIDEVSQIMGFSSFAGGRNANK